MAFALTLRRNQLKAAALSMARKDIRHYLKGLLVTVNASGQTAIVSTDGHRLFAGLLDEDQWQGSDERPITQVIIPDSAVKVALRGKGNVILRQKADGEWLLGDTTFTPIDSQFPDWLFITPRGGFDNTEQAHFNFDYLSDAQTALRLWNNNEQLLPTLQTRGPKLSALMAYGSAYVVIMPVRAHASAPAFSWNDMPQEQMEEAA